MESWVYSGGNGLKAIGGRGPLDDNGFEGIGRPGPLDDNGFGGIGGPTHLTTDDNGLSNRWAVPTLQRFKDGFSRKSQNGG